MKKSDTAYSGQQGQAGNDDLVKVDKISVSGKKDKKESEKDLEVLLDGSMRPDVELLDKYIEHVG